MRRSITYPPVIATQRPLPSNVKLLRSGAPSQRFRWPRASRQRGGGCLVRADRVRRHPDAVDVERVYGRITIVPLEVGQALTDARTECTPRTEKRALAERPHDRPAEAECVVGKEARIGRAMVRGDEGGGELEQGRLLQASSHSLRRAQLGISACIVVRGGRQREVEGLQQRGEQVAARPRQWRRERVAKALEDAKDAAQAARRAGTAVQRVAGRQLHDLAGGVEASETASGGEWTVVGGVLGAASTPANVNVPVWVPCTRMVHHIRFWSSLSTRKS